MKSIVPIFNQYGAKQKRVENSADGDKSRQMVRKMIKLKDNMDRHEALRRKDIMPKMGKISPHYMEKNS